MRTTLDIGGDLLEAAKEIARCEKSTAGAVVSRLLSRSLTGPGAAPGAPRKQRKPVAGLPPFAARGGHVASNAAVDALREAEGI